MSDYFAKPEEGDDKLLSQRQTLEPRTIDIVDENDPQIVRFLTVHDHYVPG